MLYWLMNDEALQLRMIRAIREARTPLTARQSQPTSARSLPLVVDNGVATISVRGVLTPAPDLMAECYGEANTTYADLQMSLRAAVGDVSVREIVWDIDSPGGAVDGLFALLDDISDARASGKRMRVTAESAHSAAYGIAAAAGKITARGRTSSFGSIGVATTGFVSGGLCGKAIDITDSNSPEKRPNIEDPEGRQVVVKYLDQLAAEFRTSIAAGRGVTPDHVAAEYGRGSSMLASAALASGLIDAVAARTPAFARGLTTRTASGTVRGDMQEPSQPVVTDAPTESTDPVEPDAAPEAPAAVVAPPVEPEAPAALAAAAALIAADRAELAALRADKAAREGAELRSLVTDLVALGAETPATAWVNNAPVARLASEGLPGLRSRVAALRTVKGATAAVTPPAASANPEDGLTDFERRDADKIKNPEARSRFVASRLARKNKAQ